MKPQRRGAATAGTAATPSHSPQATVTKSRGALHSSAKRPRVSVTGSQKRREAIAAGALEALCHIAIAAGIMALILGACAALWLVTP